MDHLLDIQFSVKAMRNFFERKAKCLLSLETEVAILDVLQDLLSEC